MMGTALLVGLAGLCFSAFFSGCETGFYRATRIRMVLDALEGDWIAQGLVRLTNQPTLFIATVLVGNNLANYLVSLASVIGAQTLVGTEGSLAELITPLVVAPWLFLFGELVPKNFYLHSPNRLLRASGPLFLACTVLFLPVSGLLWALHGVVSWLARESPERVRLAIARRELRRLLEEGHEAGVLHPSQRRLARGIFTVAQQPVRRFLVPLSDVPRARTDMTKAEILRLARRLHLPAVPVEHAGSPRRLVGYVRVIDLELQPEDRVAPIRPLPQIPHNDTHINALMRMHRANESLAQVVDAAGCAVGILSAARLRQPLLHGG